MDSRNVIDYYKEWETDQIKADLDTRRLPFSVGFIFILDYFRTIFKPFIFELGVVESGKIDGNDRKLICRVIDIALGEQ